MTSAKERDLDLKTCVAKYRHHTADLQYKGKTLKVKGDIRWVLHVARFVFSMRMFVITGSGEGDLGN